MPDIKGLMADSTDPDAKIREFTTAVRNGNHYGINGSKCFISNGPIADVVAIFAMTDRSKGAKGISRFIVEKSYPGFSVAKWESKMGIKGSPTGELVFEDMEVLAENLVGEEGKGFIYAMETLDTIRPVIAAQSVGLAQGALDHAIAYAEQRVQFGKPIIAFQGISWMLAEMAVSDRGCSRPDVPGGGYDHSP